MFGTRLAALINGALRLTWGKQYRKAADAQSGLTLVDV